MEVDRTILFADLCDSTGITETLGDTASRKHIGGILDDLAQITAKLGGRVIKTIGDEIMSSFETPRSCVAAAVEMQRTVSSRPPLGGIPSSIRVGLHAGPVILEGGDVFGDVVNVSARVAALAAADQILTTGATLEQMGDEPVPFRSLGVHGIRGRDEPLHLCEVLWRGETAQMTVVAPKVDHGPTPKLEIALGERTVHLQGGSSERVTLGRGSESSIVVASASASRAHAEIVSRGGRFYLADHSTNGTYLRPDGGREVFVHRDQVQLHAAGRISLGEKLDVTPDLEITFRMLYQD